MVGDDEAHMRCCKHRFVKCNVQEQGRGRGKAAGEGGAVCCSCWWRVRKMMRIFFFLLHCSLLPSHCAVTLHLFALLQNLNFFEHIGFLPCFFELLFCGVFACRGLRGLGLHPWGGRSSRRPRRSRRRCCCCCCCCFGLTLRDCIGMVVR